MIKSLTLYQPWATLLACGAKIIETRPRPLYYKGVFAIHAGLNDEYLDLCAEEPFKSVLASFGYRGPADLPLGKIIAMSNMVSCFPTVTWRYPGIFTVFPTLETIQELKFGNFGLRPDGTPRYGMVTRDPVLLKHPIPAIGHQGFWNWDETILGTEYAAIVRAAIHTLQLTAV